MVKIVPDYYKKFRCIAGSCRHNCCIGWEIDIDEDTAAYYESLPGEIGRKLKENIEWEEQPHFRLGERERCPFLNADNLCDIILTLGEEQICEICTEHPRFYNELPGRLESGIGLCCEEAARLILGWKDKVGFQATENVSEEEEDELILIRDQTIQIMQDRRLPVADRVMQMLEICDAGIPDRTMDQWIEFFLKLERLDETWTKTLEFTAAKWKQADLGGFKTYMSERQTEYEQLVIYFLYRYLATAFDEMDLAARASFAAVSFYLIYLAGAVIWTETGSFSFEDQVELVRLFSSEIEYSEENMECILDEMVSD